MMGRFLFLNEVRFLLQNAAWPDGEENQQDLDRPDLSILSAVRLGRSSEDQSMSWRIFISPRPPPLCICDGLFYQDWHVMKNKIENRSSFYKPMYVFYVRTPTTTMFIPNCPLDFNRTRRRPTNYLLLCCVYVCEGRQAHTRTTAYYRQRMQKTPAEVGNSAL